MTVMGKMTLVAPLPRYPPPTTDKNLIHDIIQSTDHHGNDAGDCESPQQPSNGSSAQRLALRLFHLVLLFCFMTGDFSTPNYKLSHYGKVKRDLKKRKKGRNEWGGSFRPSLYIKPLGEKGWVLLRSRSVPSFSAASSARICAGLPRRPAAKTGIPADPLCIPASAICDKRSPACTSVPPWYSVC